MICNSIAWRIKVFYYFEYGSHDIQCMYYISVFSYHSRDNQLIRARQKLFPRRDLNVIKCKRFIKLP